MANVLNNIGYVPTYSEFSPRLNIFIRPAEEKVSQPLPLLLSFRPCIILKEHAHLWAMELTLHVAGHRRNT